MTAFPQSRPAPASIPTAWVALPISHHFQDQAPNLNELMESHRDLVIRIATKYEGRGLLLEDLIEIGTAGLALAAPEFEPSQGVRFSTYASWWVKQAIKTALLAAACPLCPR